MRAVQATKFGGPEVLVPVDAPEPEAGADEVVVDVAVAEVIFLDTQLRAGWGRDYFPIDPPFVPGTGSPAARDHAGSSLARGRPGATPSA